MKKIHHRFFAKYRICEKTQPVSRAGNCTEPDTAGVSRSHAAAHITGNQPVVLPVDQQDRDLRPGCTILCRTGVQPETPEDPCSCVDKGIDQAGIPDVLADFSDDTPGRGIGGVGDDAGYVGRVPQFTPHQHRGRTHGQAIQYNRRCVPEPAVGPPDPAVDIPPFPDAEGDGVSAAFPVGTLVDYQGVETQPPGDGVAPAAVPQGVAPVAVAEDHQGSAVCKVVIPSPERDPVHSCDGHVFIGVLLHDPDDLEQRILHSFKLGTVQGIVRGAAALWRRVKADAVAIPAGSQTQRPQGGGDGKNTHVKTSEETL